LVQFFRLIKLLGVPIWLVLLSTGFCSASETSWAKGKSQHSQVRLISQLSSLSSKTFEIQMGLEFKLDPGWHVYWKNPGDVGYAPKLVWKLPESWLASDLNFPHPILFDAPSPDGLQLQSIGYEASAIYPIILTGAQVNPPSFAIKLNVQYLVCDDICVPESADLELSLPINSENLSKHKERLERSFSALPQPQSDVQMEWLDENEFVVDFGQTPIAGPLLLSGEGRSGIFWKVLPLTANQYRIQLKPSSSIKKSLELHYQVGPTKNSFFINIPLSTTAQSSFESFWLALLLAFVGGAILNLMPCVLPVVILKTNSLIRLRETQGLRRSLSFTMLGILTSFLCLAAVVILLKSLGQQVGWGFQFQSPVFVGLMIFVIFVFALNLFGVFEIQLPHVANNKMLQSSGPFFEGVFATALATPCSAPFLGTALSYAFTQSWPVFMLFFLVMGLGLSLPYLIIFAHPSFIRFLPRPGNWMIAMKRWLAYSLLLAVLWLLYVLQQQAGVLSSLVIVGFSLLVFIGLRELRGLLRWLIVAALLVFGLWNVQNFSSSSRRISQTEDLEKQSYRERMSEAELRVLFQVDSRPIFLNITADWCLTCKYNEYSVLKTDWFQDIIETHQMRFINVDWTKRNPEIGKFLESYGRAGIPFSMIIGPDKKLLLPELLTRATVEKRIKEFTR